MNGRLLLKSSAYLLVSVLFAAVLVLYRFPYESLQHRLEGLVAARWGLRLDLDDFGPGIPLKLRFSRCSLGQREEQPMAELEEGYLRPRLLPFFVGKIGVAIGAKAYGGFLDGNLLLKPFYDVDQYGLRLKWKEVRLEQHPILPFLLKQKISGKFSGDLQLHGSLKNPVESSGIGKLGVSNGSCPVESPYLEIDTLDDLEVNAVIKIVGAQLEINNCSFSAKGIEGTLSGGIKLRPKMSQSTLNLVGQGSVDPSLLKLQSTMQGMAVSLFKRGKPLPFKVRGTLAKPKFGLF
jgi:type II secretion system protein N